MVDFSSEFGQRAEGRLRRDGIGWLVTVGADGMPEPSPIWFYWDGETCLIYSKPKAPKLRNIQRHPQVALHLNSDEHGGNILVLTGEASIVGTAADNPEPAYIEKYRQGIAALGLTPETMAATYSTAIRFRPTRLRGW